MCRTCGCGPRDEPEHQHDGGHDHDHEEPAPAPGGPIHDHVHEPAIVLPTPILEANDTAAARIRRRLAASGVLAINVLGAPGAGKTALLERTLDGLPWGTRAGVVVADLATHNDARRLRRPGVPVVPVETGTACHLSAPVLERALERIAVDALDVLFIENVGNLVCPALFDIGEAARVVLLSVTEGSDKPEKYPVMFQQADLLLVTKMDLLAHVDFDLVAALSLARRVRPEVKVLTFSSRTGEGLVPWLEWIDRRRAEARASAATRAATAS